MERVEYIINDLFSLKIDRSWKALPWGRLLSVPWLCRPTGRTHIGEPARGPWHAAARSTAAAAVREPSESSEEKWAALQHPPVSAFSSWTAVTEHWAACQEKEVFFFPGCIRKQSDLAVLVICLQLGWLRCTSQELTSFLSVFQSFFTGAVNSTEALPSQFTEVGWESATELTPSYVANIKYLLRKIISW